MLITFCILVLIFAQVVEPPTELPELILVALGIVASIIVQFVKGKFKSRTTRFLLSLFLSVAVGVVSYILAMPAQTDPVVFVIHVFAYSQIAYNMFWKIIWEELLKLKSPGTRKVKQ